MGRRLADNGIMKEGDRLIYDGKFYQLVKNYDGCHVGVWITYARGHLSAVDAWVEISDSRAIQELAERLNTGLDKIVEGLWKSD